VQREARHLCIMSRSWPTVTFDHAPRFLRCRGCLGTGEPAGWKSVTLPRQGNRHGCIVCRDLGLDLRHMRERPVPTRLQFARDQPIGWIGSIVLPEGSVDGVARRFEVAAEGAHDPAAGLPPSRRLWRRRSRPDRPQSATHSRWHRQHAARRRRCSEGAIVHPGPAAAVARDAVSGACVLQRQEGQPQRIRARSATPALAVRPLGEGAPRGSHDHEPLPDSGRERIWMRQNAPRSIMTAAASMPAGHTGWQP
jgi:hypothetical protein